MKTSFLLITLLLVTQGSFAGDTKYNETMARNIELIYKAQSLEQFLSAINTFDRIGAAEKDKWEPYYYASFGYLMLANNEQDPGKKDAFLDQAKTAINKASGVKENESEIVAMEGFISMIRVTVDPGTRGPQYSGLAMQSFGKAITLNPENPRALALMAQMQLGMSRFFKSPTTEACATATKALEKFGTYVSENPLAPVWGKGMTEALLKECK